MSTNKIVRKRKETDSVSVFRSGFAERQTRISKREKCCLSLDKVLKQYRNSNRNKKNTKSSDHKIAVEVERSKSKGVTLFDVFHYEKFVAGDYSKETPECNDQHFLSDCAHLVS